jgi:hypothetical protein
LDALPGKATGIEMNALGDLVGSDRRFIANGTQGTSESIRHVQHFRIEEERFSRFVFFFVGFF